MWSLTFTVSFGLLPRVLGFSQGYDAYGFNSKDIIVRDVAIIGGGSAGTHAAISLKDKGKSIVLVEAKGRLGGHTQTYTDPASGTPFDYGVHLFHNTSSVRSYFQRFNIALQAIGNTPQDLANYDLRTGAAVNVTLPDQVAFGTALAKYTAVLQQYPKLDEGMILPSPVPDDLVMPFGDFAKKYGIEDAVRIMYNYNSGLGDPLTVPTVEMIRTFGLDLVTQLSTGGFLSPASQNSSELYGKAQAELLQASSLLLSARVNRSTRTQTGVELVVSTKDGQKLIRAKKLLMTTPPRSDLLQPMLSLSQPENQVFSKFVDTGYYTSLVKNTGIPDNQTIWNYVQDTPYNLPTLPAIYSIFATPIAGVKVIYYGTQRVNLITPMTDDQVKSDILTALKKLQTANPKTFKKTDPKFVAFSSHSPFYLQARPIDTKAGFYDKLYALQGVNSTYWSGASFRAQDSSAIWRFNEEQILPMLLKGL